MSNHILPLLQLLKDNDIPPTRNLIPTEIILAPPFAIAHEKPRPQPLFCNLEPFQRRNVGNGAAVLAA
jgi:hypothetical protein